MLFDDEPVKLLTMIMHYQLFAQLPDQYLVSRILALFNATTKSSDSFTINDLIEHNTVNQVKSSGILDELYELYIPCKAKVYLDNISDKKIITIIRHLLKVQNLKLRSRTIRIGINRVQQYNIIPC